MPWLYLAIIGAVVFALCFLVDLLVKKIARKTSAEQNGKSVRMPRKGAVLGTLMLFLPVVILLFWMPEGGDTLLLVGSIVVFLMGIILLVQYFAFAIYYDDTQFVCKDMHRKKKCYTYDQIRGQRSLQMKSGVHTTLYVADDVIELDSAMQGAGAFLSKAFFRWCELKNIDPDSIKNNPRMLTFFPDPDDIKKYCKK